jgi:hypothetical protein
LGSASTFAVLGYAGVTNADASVITGDLGVGWGAIEATGFQPEPLNTIEGPGTVTDGLGIVNGTIYAGGPVADAAHNAAVIAYNYLMDQQALLANSYTGVTQLSQTLGDVTSFNGGVPLTPGVYSFAPSANLKVNGTLYLNFQGNSNALFIFQTGTTLEMMANSKVIAQNTGQTCLGSNVYWAVGSSATIDGAEFVGTVIANTAITMTSAGNLSGVTDVSGRMFALGASVTMVNSMISVCGGSGGVIPPPKPPKPCRDFVTGGGWIKGNSDAKGHKNDKATFGVSGGIKNGKYWGQLSFNDHNGVKVKSTSVTAYKVIDLVTRQIEGIAKVNGKGSFTYTVVVADNGERGRNDSFSLELSNSNGYSYSASGTLKGGNIQLHTKCGDSRDKDGKDHKENYDDKDERDGHHNCDNDRD